MPSLSRIPGLILISFASACPALGATLDLSQLVSGDPTPPSAEDLDATLEFVVNSAADGVFTALPATLEVTVTNNTGRPAGFVMHEIYFNVPDNVSEVLLTRNPTHKWEANFDNGPGGGIMVDGFGHFDLQLLDAPGGGVAKINPGRDVVFEITLQGTGFVRNDDFISEFSTVPEEMVQTVVAAKFEDGPSDKSAFGASLPEPAILAMFALGGWIALFRRR